jgi:single-stranded-DNA-specific exonuclease
VTAADIWRVVPHDGQRARSLAAAAGTSQLVAKLLLARGVDTAEDAAKFFDPSPDRLHDPLRMKGVPEAVDVLHAAARSGRRIAVFGDYDVDGVTSVAQLSAVLRRAGADTVAFLPHRLRDGYGLKPATVRRVLSELSPAVIVTVDCGITAVEGVACARAAGVEVVVTDHHLVPDELPAGAVVVNPKQPGCEYPYKDLAAAGVALKIACALAARAGVRLPTESLLRVACLGTIADVVPLSGENRVIAAAGLAALASARAPGLRALLAEAGVTGRAPTSEEVAFRVAPRLNAAGRLDTAELALSLLEERDPVRAVETAGELSRRNAERQSIERRIVREAREKAGKEFDPGRDAVLVAWDPGWHRGVLGIAASRLAREYHRPVLLFGVEGDRATGSGRSIPGVSLHDLLRELAPFFEEFGGHDQAVGATLDAGRLPALRRAAQELFAARVDSERLVRIREADADLDPSEADDSLCDWLARFEPHGAGNPRPVFRAQSCTFDGPFHPLGDNGLRGRLRGTGAAIGAITWERSLLERVLSGGHPVEAHYSLGRNRMGRVEAEIVAARPASKAGGLGDGTGG